MSEVAKPQSSLTARLIYWILVTLIYLPLLGLVLTTLFKRNETVYAFTLEWFVAVLQDERLLMGLRNSFIIAALTGISSVLLGTAYTVAVGKLSKVENQVGGTLIQMALVFPEIVFALSLLFWFYLLDFTLGIGTVLLAHLTFTLPYVIKSIEGRMSMLEQQLFEAAEDLGSSYWYSLRKITFPLLKPAIAGAFITAFLLSFDDFLITFFVNGVEYQTLPIILYTSMKTGLTPKLGAVAIIMFLINALLVWFLFTAENYFKASRK